MSFDLFFCRPDGSVPGLTDLKAYFESRPLFKIIELEKGGAQFWYENAVTGVYADISYTPAGSLEIEEDPEQELSFNLNYIRPSFFAFEVMPVIQEFCVHFDLFVDDPQTETKGPAAAMPLIASWRDHNTRAVNALAQDQESGVRMLFLAERRATAWWQYAQVKQRIQESLTQDIFTPEVFIFESPQHSVFTMIVWPNAIPLLLPSCDYLLMQRESKRLFRTTEESGLVSYDSVIASLTPFLANYEVSGVQISYLAPGNMIAARDLHKKVELKPIDLSKHNRLAADGFHDVELG